MPFNNEQHEGPDGFVGGLGPLKLYLVRMPDDERERGKIVVGTVIKANGVKFLRTALDRVSWDFIKAHDVWKEPATLVVHARKEDPGIVIVVGVPVPYHSLPAEVRSQLATPDPDDAWRGDADVPEGSQFVFPLGRIVRYARAFHHGGDLIPEAMCTLNSAMKGNVIEPWEQALG